MVIIFILALHRQCGKIVAAEGRESEGVGDDQNEDDRRGNPGVECDRVPFLW
ncbi:hypothetical protein [Novosphingobium colocasiae]|uniref:hypothetical protein n=1 Tax=Novosphingobium colocasiae TaxID=1256513 RepID=UPI0016779270|nr:hypothetical protein [Novosphingobium colocasiae]